MLIDTLHNGTPEQIEALMKDRQAKKISFNNKLSECHIRIAKYQKELENATGPAEKKLITKLKRAQTIAATLTHKDLELKNRLGADLYQNLMQFPAFVYCRLNQAMRRDRRQEGIQINTNIITSWQQLYEIWDMIVEMYPQLQIEITSDHSCYMARPQESLSHFFFLQCACLLLLFFLFSFFCFFFVCTHTAAR